MSSDAKNAVDKIEAAPVVAHPFPHLVIDEIFPADYYAEMMRYLPPIELLQIPKQFGMMKIGDDDQTFASISPEARAFWSRFDTDIKAPICGALLRKFKPYLAEKLRLACGHDLQAMPADDEFRPLRGIVQCRTTGARMGPHVDKATSLFTYLFYFATDDSLRPFGTILYDTKNRDHLVDRFRHARRIRAWFPDETERAAIELTPMPPIEFCRNRLVAYANLPYSMHGAATDAAAPRYSMQNYCDIPASIALPAFEGWNDNMSPTGIYRGDG